MKNKILMNHRGQTQVPDWLLQETPEDDFLMGKTQTDLPDIWEDEE